MGSTRLAEQYGQALNKLLDVRLLSVFYTLCVFVLEWYTPLGFAHGYLYLPGLVLISLANVEDDLTGYYLLSLVLIMSGMFISSQLFYDYFDPLVIANRLTSLVLLTLLYLALNRKVLHIRKVIEEKESYRQVLDVSDLVKFDLHGSSGRIQPLRSREWFEAIYDSKLNDLHQFVQQAVEPKHKDRLLSELQSAFTMVAEFELEFLSRSLGSKPAKWLRLQGRPLADKPGHFHCILQDITTSRAFRAVKARERAQFMEMTDRLPIYVWMADPKGNITFVNKCTLEELGYEYDYLVSQWPKLIHPEDAQRVMSQWQGSIEGGEDLLVEYRFKTADGAYVPLLATGYANKDKDGNVLGWVGTGTNLSRLKLLEDEKATLISMVENSNEAIMLYDSRELHQKGPIISYVNKRFEAITGFSKGEVLGKSPSMLEGEKTDKTKLSQLHQAMVKGQAQKIVVTLYTKRQQEFISEINLFPLADKPHMFVVIQRDISREKRMQRLIERNKKMDSLGHLTGGIAHDFNNLLAIIAGNAELLKRMGTDGRLSQDKTLELASAIYDAAGQGQQLTGSLLAFAKGNNKQKENTNVCQVIKDIYPMLNSALGGSHVLSLETRGDLHATIAGADLESIMLNMVINARDALDDNHAGSLEIQVGPEYLDSQAAGEFNLQAGHYVQIKVEDNGKGIEPDIIDNLYDPFFSTKNESHSTGLGLSMVYAHIKRVGGAIDVASTPGKGTCFTMMLPEVAARVSENNAGPVKLSREVETVVLVEDNPMVAMVSKGLLQELNLEVLHFASSNEALKAIQEGLRFDLLMTDILIPDGLNGDKLAEAVEALIPGCPVVFVSGYAAFEICEEDIDKQNRTFVSKPFSQDDLLRAINKVTANSQAA